jgi:hypothetical protein
VDREALRQVLAQSEAQRPARPHSLSERGRHQQQREDSDGEPFHGAAEYCGRGSSILMRVMYCLLASVGYGDNAKALLRPLART